MDSVAGKSRDQMEARLALVQQQERELGEVINNDYQHLGQTKERLDMQCSQLQDQIDFIQVQIRTDLKLCLLFSATL